MELNNLVRIKPLTHKTKNRVANHGWEWRVKGIHWKYPTPQVSLDDILGLWLEVSLPADPSMPYSFWGEVGKDFSVEGVLSEN